MLEDEVGAMKRGSSAPADEADERKRAHRGEASLFARVQRAMQLALLNRSLPRVLPCRTDRRTSRYGCDGWTRWVLGFLAIYTWANLHGFPLGLEVVVWPVEVVDPAIYTGCKESDAAKRIAIVMPFFHAQVDRLTDNLRTWSVVATRPCRPDASNTQVKAGVRADLVLYYDRPASHLDPAARHRIDDQLAALGTAVTSCFGEVRYEFGNLSEADGSNSVPWPFNQNWIRGQGMTRGTVQQFYAALHHAALKARYSHMFYMEPDTLPVRQDWLTAVVAAASTIGGDFWMKGSAMRYPPRFNIAFEPYRTNYLRHINGNAIYKLGDPCFEAFIKHVRAEYQYFAFDTSINYFRYSSRHVRMFQATAHKFMYTTVVVDYSSVPYDDATLQELPGCFLVHGKYMMLSKEKTALARLGLGTSGT